MFIVPRLIRVDDLAEDQRMPDNNHISLGILDGNAIRMNPMLRMNKMQHYF